MNIVRKCKQYLFNLASTRPVLFYSLLLVLIAFISHWQWFNPHSILEYGDWQYRPDESVRQQVSSWMTWVPFNNLGSANVLMSGFPLRGLAWGMITQLGFSYDIATKLTLFLPVALGGFLVPFWVGRAWFKHTVIAFFVALFYGSTAYYLTLQTGHLPIAIIYAFLPLIVWLLDKSLRTNELRDWLLLALAFCVGIFYEVRIMYIVTCVLLLYLTVFMLTHRARLTTYLKNIGIVSLFIALANVFWLIPTKIAAAQGIGEIAGRGLFGDSLFTLQQSFGVMKWSWTGGAIDRTFVAQPVPPYLFIIPIIICIGLIVLKTYRGKLLFYLVLTAIGIILTKQSAEPFASLYGWLYDNFPGFVLFREASKFYIVVAFGYFGLLGYGLLALKDHGVVRGLRTKAAYLYPLALIGIIFVAGMNLWPAASTTLGNTFKNAQMPADYVTLKRFIKDQPDYFRTYWVPRESWWGFYDNNHPKVRAVDILVQDWKELPITKGSGSGYDLAQSTVDVFSQPYSADLFRNASIKYIIVPLRDTVNDDDFFGSYGDDRTYYTEFLDDVSFLKRLNIGTKEVAVYENTAYRPYISTASRLYQGDQSTLLRLTGNTIDAKRGDTTDTDVPDMVPANRVDTMFDLKDAYTVDGTRATQQKTTGDASQLRIAPQRSINYTIADGTLSLETKKTGSVLVDGAVVRPPQESQSLGQLDLNKEWEYYLDIDGALQPLKQDEVHSSFGVVNQQATFWTASKSNLIPNGSFTKGLWQKEVTDCNPYDNKAQLDMRLDPVGSGGNQNSLQLGAFKHTACTEQQNIPVTAGKRYYFGFDYQMNGGQKVGYEITFNDPAKTVLKHDIATHDKGWHTYMHRIDAPAGATAMTLRVYGYASETQLQFALTHYDKFRLSPLTERLRLDAAPATSQNVALGSKQSTIAYEADKPFTNLVKNGSLEQGLWQKKVKDCNEYDANAAIDMQQDGSTARDGKQSLLLIAKRHTACTSPDQIAVTQNNTYQLRFSYKSSTAQNASYSLRFNDSAGSTEGDRIPIKGSGWHDTTIRFTVPKGATKVTLTLYAEPQDDNKEVRVNYDDIRVTDVTPLVNNFLVTRDAAPLRAPDSIAFNGHSPTRKTIAIKGAHGPFYLIMNEAFHPGWRLVADNAKATGLLNSWRPAVHPDMVPQQGHFKANVAMNGWYVDVAAFCKDQPACTKNADGSYDIALIAEFAPQRVFYGGLIVSGGAFAAAIGYVIWARKGGKRLLPRKIRFRR